MYVQSSSFSFGLYPDPASKGEPVFSLKEAEAMAKCLSEQNGGRLVAIWQDEGKVVRLFFGSDEFIRVEL